MTTKQQKQLIKLTYKLELISAQIDELLVDEQYTLNMPEESLTIVNALETASTEMYGVTLKLVRLYPELEITRDKAIAKYKQKIIRDEEQ